MKYIHLGNSLDIVEIKLFCCISSCRIYTDGINDLSYTNINNLIKIITQYFQELNGIHGLFTIRMSVCPSFYN